MIARVGIAGLVSLLCGQAALAGTITVVPSTELRNSEGTFRCALFKNKEGYPTQHLKATYRVTAPITQARSVCVFKDVPAGTYALTVLHDENDNETMDNHQTGMPLEGFGSSNDADAGLVTPPTYADAAFTVTEADQKLSLLIRYAQP